MGRHQNTIRFAGRKGIGWELGTGVLALASGLALLWGVYARLGAPVHETWSVAGVIVVLVGMGAVEITRALPRAARVRRVHATRPDHA